jgi:Na+/melibiose symporter-like transporter
VGLALPILGWVGYQPNVEQTPEVVTTLKALYALAPAVLTVAGLLIAWNYPIGRREHGAILDAIEARRQGGTPVDPLTGKPA